MTIKTLMVFVDDSRSCEKRTRFAVELARYHGAHLIGLYVAGQDEPKGTSRAYIRGEATIRAMIDRERKAENTRFQGAKREFDHATALESLHFEFRAIAEADAMMECKRQSLQADLIIVGFPSPGGLPRNWSAEEILLATGVPFLIVPAEWNGEPIAERVLVGWNATREARRAIQDALPLLIAAKTVSLLIVDGEKNAPQGEEPGTDAAILLARHGVNVSLDRVRSEGRQVAEILMTNAKQQDAGLIVIGAYSHSRMRETAFGGVTRTLLESIEIPLLIAH